MIKIRLFDKNKKPVKTKKVKDFYPSEKEIITSENKFYAYQSIGVNFGKETIIEAHYIEQKTISI